MGQTSLNALLQLGPRALAVVVRRLVLPVQELLREGPYGPFVEKFSRTCDGAELWYALGHDPDEVERLELEAVEMRGTAEEQQIWSTLWSASRAMEFARLGNLEAARSQFLHTLELIDDWSRQKRLRDAARLLQEQATAYVIHVADVVRNQANPPLDRDAFVIPAFYCKSPNPPEDSSTRFDVLQNQNALRGLSQTAHDASFDAEVDALIHFLITGRVAVFCGAGISIASGIPAARALRTAILERLPASQRELEWLADCELPFEAFMDCLRGESDLKSLYDVFAGTMPSEAHLFFAELASRGLLRTIATTNFDELIEKALTQRGVRYRALWRPTDLAAPQSEREGIEVIKVHGTLCDQDSLALTMEQVAGHQPVLGRQQAIRRLFADGNHEAVLLLGYSCSDVFDVTPHIEALVGPRKRIFLVEHVPSIRRAEDIRRRQEKNPFRSFPLGTRLMCDTNELLEHLSLEIVADRLSSPQLGTKGSSWLRAIGRWSNSLSSTHCAMVGHMILGQLWYACSDYRAAKAHYRAALAEVTPIIVGSMRDDFAFDFMLPIRAGNEQLRYRALLRVGACHRALSEYSQAMECFREANELARSFGDDYTEAEVLGAMGTVLFNTGKFADAVRSYKHSIEIWKRLGSDLWSLGRAFANLGNAYGAVGKYKDALSAFQNGIEIARQIGDKAGEASRLGGAAQVYQLMGKLLEAEDTLRKAVEIADALGDRSLRAHQLGSLAMIDGERGDLNEAVEKSLRAAALFRDLGDRQGEARALGNAGKYSLSAGRIDAGIDSLIDSLDLASAIGDPSALNVALRHLQAVVRKSAASKSEIEQATILLESFRKGHNINKSALRDVLTRLAQNRAKIGRFWFHTRTRL